MSELDQTNQLSQAPQPQDVIQQQNQLQAPLISTPPQQPVVNAASENLQCQWQGCGERCPSAEALYVSYNARTCDIRLADTYFRSTSVNAMSAVRVPIT